MFKYTSSLLLQSDKKPSYREPFTQVKMIFVHSTRNRNLQIIFNEAMNNSNHIALCVQTAQSKRSELLETCLRQMPRLPDHTYQHNIVLRQS